MHYRAIFNSHEVSDELKQKLVAMPKVEIHVHLEGATDAATIFSMAQRNHTSLPGSTLEEWEKFYVFRDFNHFIDIYLLAAACMQTPDDFVEMVENFLRNQARQNILYSEVYFSPLLHAQKLSQDDLLAALAEGAKNGEAKYGSRIKFIPDITREIAGDDPQIQKDVLEFAFKARDMGIGVGLGVGGKEIGYPPELFRDIFAEARRQDLHVVAHGGETGDAQSVRGALDALEAQRIGHGIRALEDQELVDVLRERQIMLEVSPQSNYCIGVVRRDEPHPIRRMVDAGLKCSVNSDDPPMFQTDLNNEYLTLAAQGFTFEELWQLNINSLDAAFLGDVDRQYLRRRWDEFAA